MRRLLALTAAVQAVGCRISLEKEEAARACKVSTTSMDCLDAPEHEDLAWIEAKVFEKSCTFSGCHNGAATDAGRLNLKVGNAHASLVGVSSAIAQDRTLVVPGDPAKSYLLVMLRHIEPGAADPPAEPPPESVGYMPQNAGGAVLCCQKLDAIARWIEAGAPAN